MRANASTTVIEQAIEDAADAGNVAPHLLVAARQMLLDPQKRAHYDQRLSRQLMDTLPVLEAAVELPRASVPPQRQPVSVKPTPVMPVNRRPELGVRYQERVVRWGNERGFGFVLPQDGGKEVFFAYFCF